MANENDAVLAAIHGLAERFQSLEQRFGQLEQRADAQAGELRHELVRTRTDIMARIDRLQATASEIKEDLTVTHAATERAERTTEIAREEVEGVRTIVRGLRADMGTLNRQVMSLASKSRRLTDRVEALEGGAAS